MSGWWVGSSQSTLPLADKLRLMAPRFALAAYSWGSR